MDSYYYTLKAKKYPDERNVYHVLNGCPRGRAIKSKHREYGLPSPSQHRHPCEACLSRIEKWLTSLPVNDRPTWLR